MAEQKNLLLDDISKLDKFKYDPKPLNTELYEEISDLKKLIHNWKEEIGKMGRNWSSDMLASVDSHYAVYLNELASYLSELEAIQVQMTLNNCEKQQLHRIAASKFKKLENNSISGTMNHSLATFLYQEELITDMQAKINNTSKLGTKVKGMALLTDLNIEDTQAILNYLIG